MVTAEDRRCMGSKRDATKALKVKAREWREVRQLFMGTSREHKARGLREQQLRFELANAALLWLWHQENPQTEVKG